MIKLGISTFPTEIDNPRIAVPKNRLKLPDHERNKIPIVRGITDQNNTTSAPYLRAIPGTRGENNANANNGRVVIIPAKVFEMSKLSRIRLTKGPTDVKGALRFVARKEIPIISISEVGVNMSSLCLIFT